MADGGGAEFLKRKLREIEEREGLLTATDAVLAILELHPGIRVKTLSRLAENYHRRGILPWRLDPPLLTGLLRDLRREGRVRATRRGRDYPYAWWPEKV